jgi:hypothetical protein
MNYYRLRYFSSSASLETIEIKAKSIREAIRLAIHQNDITENNIFSINLIN